MNVNLDSIYEIDGKKVYALAKNKTEEVNLFYLNIMVVFIDGTTSEASTKQFKIVGKAKDAVKNGKGAMEEEVSIEGILTCSYTFSTIIKTTTTTATMNTPSKSETFLVG